MKRYEIVLIDFPFVDKPWESKKRPCVLLSHPKGEHGIVVIEYITSKEVISKISDDDILIKPDTQNNLTKDSVVQVYKLASVMENVIIASVGTLSEKDSQKIEKSLSGLFELGDQD
jgi:mRNA-degrading endonuclease toxin of MazEF toxin-antitoxin module